MNFTYLPELSWTYGYPFALVLMAVVAAGLWALFKKSGWL
jgi:magnesium transporter